MFIKSFPSKRVAILSLLLNFLFILFFAGKRIYFSAPNTSLKEKPDAKYLDSLNLAGITRYGKYSIDSTNTVLVGTSLTEGFPIQSLAAVCVKNRGISGNQANHILSRINQIVVFKPKNIFLEVGANDVNNGIPMDTLLSNVEKIINVIESKSPLTKIYVQSIFPTGRNFKKNMQYIPTANEGLKRIAKRHKATYIDIYSLLYEDGGLNDSLTYDGLHLNDNGYFTWKNAIDNLIKN